MWFLIRMAFWLGLVLVLLPSGSTQPVAPSQVSASEAFSAARAAVSDMQQFCERQPEACQVGSQAATTIGQRAQAGAKILYEFLQAQFGNPPGRDEPDGGRSETGSIPLPVAKPSQHTLRPSDLQPAWSNPAPARSARNPRTAESS